MPGGEAAVVAVEAVVVVAEAMAAGIFFPPVHICCRMRMRRDVC
jgi:hypothetical protein